MDECVLICWANSMTDRFMKSLYINLSMLLVMSLYNDRQRAGIADGGELEFRPPGTTADIIYYDEVRIK